VNDSRRAAYDALSRFVAQGRLPAPDSEAAAARLAEAAVEQGLAGLLDDAVAGSPVWPAAARETLRSAHRDDLVRGERLRAASCRAIRLLERSGLRALPMKGAAAADWLYADAGHRRMADADVLALDDWRASTRVLADAGYQTIDRAAHAWALREPDSPLVVELHHSLSSCPGLFPIDHEGLWSRRRAAPDGLSRPALADFVAQTAVHCAFQHGFRVRLGQYLDLRRALEHERIESATLGGIAKAYRAEACVAAALEAAGTLVGGALAAPVSPALSSRVRARLHATLESVRDGGPFDALDLAAWRARLTRGRRLALFAGTLAPLHPGDDEGLGQRGLRGLRRGASLLARAFRLAGVARARV